MDEIRSAATILLIRDIEEGIEILLMRRSAKSPFMPDAYVYPGGALETADAHVETQQLASECADTELREYYVASIRECFEESNILVATCGDLPQGEQRKKWREKLVNNEAFMPEFLKHHGLLLDLQRVKHFDQWVTPPFESRRFDTHFFVVEVSEEAAAIQDDYEVVDARWFEPVEALRQHAEGELLLFPPTWATLSWLSQFSDSSSALAAADKRDVYPVEPYFSSVGDAVVAYLPGHPQHPSERPDEVPVAIWRYEGSWSFRRDCIEFAWHSRADESL